MRVRGQWFRHHAPETPATKGTARSWRWNPAGVLTLYLASSKQACRDELVRFAARVGFRPEELLPRALTSVEVALSDVAALRNIRELAQHDLTLEDIRSMVLDKCQAVGGAIATSGKEGLVAPSSVGNHQTLAVFLDNLRNGSSLAVITQELM